MLAPVPIAQAPRVPMTTGLAALSILVSLAFWAHWDVSPLVADTPYLWREPWRLLTTVLPHLDIMHLAFNVYWVWVFGARLEQLLGHVRFGLLVLVLALGSSAAEIAFLDGGVGLSGVGYGLFGFVWILSRKDPRYAGFCDQRTVLLFLVWFVLCVALTVTHVWLIANIAHGVGAVLGVLAGYAMVSPERRALILTSLIAATMAFLLGATAFRPWINLSHDGGRAAALEGYLALEAKNYAEGLRMMKLATSYRFTDANWWYNLGVAHNDLEQWSEGAAAFQRACQMEPGNTAWREALESVRANIALAATRPATSAPSIAP